MQSGSNIPSVTMLRGLACLGVCVMHFSGTIESTTYKEIARYGGYGVPIFFAISGFILPFSLERANYKLSYFFSFILKRIIRLEPAYLVSIIGVFLLSALAQFSKFNSSEQIDIFTRNTLLHLFYLVDIFDGKWLNPVYWSLAIEFLFYLIVGLIFPFLRSGNKYVLMIIFVILCVGSLPFENDIFLPHYVLMFLPGITLFWYTSNRISLTLFIVMGIILGSAGFYKHGIMGPICEVLSISFMLFVSKPIKPLLFLGTISYSLYLTHTIVGTDGIINFLQNYLLAERERIWLMILSFPVVVAFSWVFYRFIEYPSMKLSKKIVYGSKNQQT